MLNKQAAAHYDAAKGYNARFDLAAARGLCRWLKAQRRDRDALKDDPFPRVRNVTTAFLMLLPSSALDVLAGKIHDALWGKSDTRYDPSAISIFGARGDSADRAIQHATTLRTRARSIERL